MPRYAIRPMRLDEIALAADWAAAEGWNPGLADAGCFATVDPHGFLIGEWDGEPAATISCVAYDDAFAFLGFYIVRPDLRGRGYGLQIWNAALAHAGRRTIGLDGVVAQQENYRKSGFTLAHANIRYGGPLPSGIRTPTGLVPLAEVPLATIEASDRAVFPAPRAQFLETWISAPRHIGLALLRDGGLAAWGVIRPCREGYKIGPLVAETRADAETILHGLLADIPAGETIFLDVPAPHSAAVALAQSLNLAPVFETARMYRGAAPRIQLERIFGITTFELG